MPDVRRSRQLLSLTVIFFWASEYCHVPYFTPYLETLGFAAAVIGFITGTYGFTQTVIRIPLGMATDATGAYKTTIVLGTVFTTLSSFILIFVTDMIPIIICRVLAGMASSSWLAFTVLYNACCRADESVQAMTGINAFNNAGKLLAFVLGMITSSLWGYRVPLVCSFLTGCAAIVCALKVEPVPMRREPFRVGHVFSVLKVPAVIVSAVFAAVMQFYMQGTVFSFTSAVAKSLNASPFAIGLATVLYTAVQVLSARYIGHHLLKRMSAAAATSLGCGLMTASAVCIAFSGGMLPIYLGQLLAGVANLTLSGVLMALAIRYVPQERQSTAMGLYQSIYGVGMSLGPVAVGRLIAAGTYRSAYLVVAGLMAAAAAAAPGIIAAAERRSAEVH